MIFKEIPIHSFRQDMAFCHDPGVIFVHDIEILPQQTPVRADLHDAALMT